MASPSGDRVLDEDGGIVNGRKEERGVDDESQLLNCVRLEAERDSNRLKINEGIERREEGDGEDRKKEGGRISELPVEEMGSILSVHIEEDSCIGGRSDFELLGEGRRGREEEKDEHEGSEALEDYGDMNARHVRHAGCSLRYDAKGSL